MNICHDCGHPIEPNKPHNHNTLVTIRGEKQALKDSKTISKTNARFEGRRTLVAFIPIIMVVKQESE